jgi:DNA-binding response OmpR family regulator
MTRYTTLIALTGWGSADDRRRTKEAGFDYHLTKPVDIRELERLFASIDLSHKPNFEAQ